MLTHLQQRTTRPSFYIPRLPGRRPLLDILSIYRPYLPSPAHTAWPSALLYLTSVCLSSRSYRFICKVSELASASCAGCRVHGENARTPKCRPVCGPSPRARGQYWRVASYLVRQASHLKENSANSPRSHLDACMLPLRATPGLSSLPDIVDCERLPDRPCSPSSRSRTVERKATASGRPWYVRRVAKSGIACTHLQFRSCAPSGLLSLSGHLLSRVAATTEPCDSLPQTYRLVAALFDSRAAFRR